MDENTLRELFGWMPDGEAPNYRRVEFEGRSYLQILIPMGMFAGYACIPLQGRPDMSRPHGKESVLRHLRERLEAYVQRHGSDVGFQLTEEDLDEIADEVMDYYRRRRFLLEDASPAGEFGVVISDGEHALAMLDLLDRYSPDRERVWNHRKYEPYIRCHVIKARVLSRLVYEDYPGIVTEIEKGLSTMRALDEEHEAWEYADIDDTIRPQGLFEHLREMGMELLQAGQENAVEQERYEQAGVIRDLIAQFEKEAAEL